MTGRQSSRQADLEALGLTRPEAAAYAALVESGSLGASAVADATTTTRTTAYQALRSLVDHGLVETGAGYGARFSAVPPEVAIPAFLARQKEELTRHLSERELLAQGLIDSLAATATPAGEEEVIEIIRNRRAVGERFERLEAEAQEEVWVFVKAPFATSGSHVAQEEAMGRGIRYRGLYEQSIVDDPEIGPYLGDWIAAGEEARVYPGELPFKMALFDGRIALVPLETPDDRHAVTSILIRHGGLGVGLRTLFECLWERSSVIEEGLGLARSSLS